MIQKYISSILTDIERLYITINNYLHLKIKIFCQFIWKLLNCIICFFMVVFLILSHVIVTKIDDIKKGNK